jgi:hypothetical protein
MTDARALLQAAIQASGGNGLCNPDQECGCGIDDIAPGQEGCIDLDACQVARKMKSEPDSEEMANYGLEYYQVVE